MAVIWSREIWLLVSTLWWTHVAMNRSVSFLGLYFPSAKRDHRVFTFPGISVLGRLMMERWERR